MELWQRTREFGRGTEVPEDDIAKARGKLVAQTQGAAAPSRARSPRRPVWIGAGTLAGAAAVTVGVLLIAQNQSVPTLPEAIASPTPVVTPKPVPTPTPTATAEPVTPQSVLAGAANVAAAQPGPVAGAGQYLKVAHVVRQLTLYSPEDPLTLSRIQATSGWVSTSTYTSYIPADSSAEWVDVFHPDLQIVDLFGADAAARSDAWMAEFSWRTEPIFVRYGGGSSPDDHSPVALRAHYPEMPRESTALVEWLRAYLPDDETPESVNTMIVELLMQELQRNAAPSDLRAAMYRTLALMPGATIEGTDGDVVTLGFATYPADERWDSIAIDTRTARVISVATTFGAGGSVVPDDVPNFITTQTVSVVDGTEVP